MEKFITSSPHSKELLISAKLLQGVNVHALIYGEEGVGKKTLATYIIPNCKIFNAKALQEEIKNGTLNLNKQSIIITNIENITNIDLLLSWVKKNKIRIIATSKTKILNKTLNNIFCITLKITPLSQRKEDLTSLTEKFSKEASNIFRCEQMATSKLIVNTSKNAHSLKKSIYFSYLLDTIKQEEILVFLENYIFKNLKGENSYKDLLYLFEVPLLEAAKKRYKSQVQMAKHLGLNRITLRKKLHIYDELLT